MYRDAADVVGSPRAMASICLVTARTFAAAVSMTSWGRQPRVVACSEVRMLVYSFDVE